MQQITNKFALCQYGDVLPMFCTRLYKVEDGFPNGNLAVVVANIWANLTYTPHQCI